MIVGFLTAAGVAAYLSSTPDAPDRARFPIPVTNGPPAVREWRVMSASPDVPAITYLVPRPDDPSVSVPTVVIACKTVSIDVRVRGFTPDHAWPQPALTTRVGDVERTGSPAVTASGERPALGYGFAIADEVLEPLGRGEPISFTFNGSTLEPPTIPEAMRSEFVDRCGALVHPGMRRRGAAGDRVY